MSVKPVISALLATAALLSAGSAAAIAVAMPNVVVTPGSSTSGGVTLAAEPTVIDSRVSEYVESWGKTSQTVVTKDVTKVVIAPTTTSAGLAELYKSSTVTTTVTNGLASYDQFQWVQSMTGTSAPNEFITFSGQISATKATYAWLTLEVTGLYTPQTSPFGTAVPALPSLYFRFLGSPTWTALSSDSTTNTNTSFFVSSAYQSLDLPDNTTWSFEVAALGGSAVNLESFSVSVNSASYNFRDQVVSVTTATTETLVGAQLLAPVPEPETYALFAAGLLFVVMRLRNRNR
jgi:hypothetical protein